LKLSLRSCVGLALLLASSLTGCATAGKADAASRWPKVDVTATHRVGSPLGPVEGAGAAEALELEDALALEICAEWLEVLPADGEPLAAHARLVSAERGGEPIEPRSQLASGARLLRGLPVQALRARELAPVDPGVRCHQLALPRGVTAALALRDELGQRGENGEDVQRELRVEVGRARDGVLSLALSLEDLAESRVDENGVAAGRLARRESLLLDLELQPEGEPIAIVLPRAGPGPRGWLVTLALRGQASPEALAACVESARAAESGALERTTWIDSGEARRREIESALRALSALERRRAALVFLAAQARAELCGDLALSGSDEVLASFAERLAAELPELSELARDGATLGWTLERGAARFLAARAAEQPLEPELAAVVLRRTGELGRSPAALAEVASRARNLPEFAASLATENRVLLEDSHPAARVRAFDWLAARGLAPQGYDPLASVEERRAALEREERP
jgi:hypothetical protein